MGHHQWYRKQKWETFDAGEKKSCNKIPQHSMLLNILYILHFFSCFLILIRLPLPAIHIYLKAIASCKKGNLEGVSDDRGFIRERRWMKRKVNESHWETYFGNGSDV